VEVYEESSAQACWLGNETKVAWRQYHMNIYLGISCGIKYLVINYGIKHLVISYGIRYLLIDYDIRLFGKLVVVAKSIVKLLCRNRVSKLSIKSAPLVSGLMRKSHKVDQKKEKQKKNLKQK